MQVSITRKETFWHINFERDELKASLGGGGRGTQVSQGKDHVPNKKGHLRRSREGEVNAELEGDNKGD